MAGDPIPKTGKLPKHSQAERRKAWEREFRAAAEIVKKRSRGRCERCSGVASQVHHIRKRGAVDDNAPQNLAHLCAHCHKWVHENPAIAGEDGWLDSRWAGNE